MRLRNKSAIVVTGVIGLLGAVLAGTGEFILHFDALARFDVEYAFLVGRYSHSIPDERKQRVGQPVEPAEVCALATGPGEIQPDIQKLVYAQSRDVIDFETTGFQKLPPDVVVPFKRHDVPAKRTFGNHFAARFMRDPESSAIFHCIRGIVVSPVNRARQ